jgi:hypothetical protein
MGEAHNDIKAEWYQIFLMCESLSISGRLLVRCSPFSWRACQDMDFLFTAARNRLNDFLLSVLETGNITTVAKSELLMNSVDLFGGVLPGSQYRSFGKDHPRRLQLLDKLLDQGADPNWDGHKSVSFSSRPFRPRTPFSRCLELFIQQYNYGGGVEEKAYFTAFLYSVSSFLNYGARLAETVTFRYSIRRERMVGDHRYAWTRLGPYLVFTGFQGAKRMVLYSSKLP